MLVKFGKLGKPIREYFMEDDATLEDLLEIIDVSIDDDDTLKRISGGSTHIIDFNDNENLRDGATYILERIEFTQQEEKIAEILDDEWDAVESVANKKATIKKIMSCGWDK